MAAAAGLSRVNTVVNEIVSAAKNDVNTFKSLERWQIAKCLAVIAGIPAAIGLAGGAVAVFAYGALPATATVIALMVGALALMIISDLLLPNFATRTAPTFRSNPLPVAEHLSADECGEVVNALRVEFRHSGDIHMRDVLLAAINNYLKKSEAKRSEDVSLASDKTRLDSLKEDLKALLADAQPQLGEILKDCSNECKGESAESPLRSKLEEIRTLISEHEANPINQAFATQLNELGGQLSSLHTQTRVGRGVVINRIVRKVNLFLEKIERHIPDIKRGIAELQQKLGIAAA